METEKNVNDKTQSQLPINQPIDNGGLMSGEFGDTTSTVEAGKGEECPKQILTGQDLRDRVFEFISEGRFE